MQVVVFRLGQASFALKMDAVARVLAPDEPPPPEAGARDLAQILELPPDPSPAVAPPRSHSALLSGHALAIRMGWAQGVTELAAEWILPLPGYMFKVSEVPFRGLFESREAGIQAHSRVLLLNEERLAAPSFPRRAGPSRPPARIPVETGAQETAGVVLWAGSRRIILPLTAIRQVVPAEALTMIPLAWPHVAGALVRDGRVIPVYHLGELPLGRGAAPYGRMNEIVIVEEEGILAGFLVEGTQTARQAHGSASMTLGAKSLMAVAGVVPGGGDVAAQTAQGE